MFFSKKSKGPEVNNIMFSGESGFIKIIASWMGHNTAGVVVSWFRRDNDNLKAALPAQKEDRFVLADTLLHSGNNTKSLLFAGHHPLRATELTLWESCSLKEILVVSHLDMPLLKTFGADHIKNVINKMGLPADEPLGLEMAAQTIKVAQDAIAKKSFSDMPVFSEEEWMNTNIVL